MVNTKEAKYAEIAQRMRNLPLDRPAVSHEWEELVQKMCASVDDGLRDIGNKEHDALKQTLTKQN